MTDYIKENSSNNLDEPVSDLIDAAVGATPQVRDYVLTVMSAGVLTSSYCYTPGMKARFEMFLARYLPIYLIDIYTEMNVNLKLPASVLERKRLQRESKKLH
uniref:(California timema) hypothetical protein n=1 Tax=Timema californicum TaxID=61474 RepID=A0A7R9JJX1_TIMCA|nr:unnamed protein product [Timema californicum]